MAELDNRPVEGDVELDETGFTRISHKLFESRLDGCRGRFGLNAVADGGSLKQVAHAEQACEVVNREADGDHSA